MKIPILLSLILLLSCRPGSEDRDVSGSIEGSSIRESNLKSESLLETVSFRIVIDASRETVYNSLTDPAYFKTWTAPFQPTSYFEGEWKQGSTIHFLSLDESGNRMGLISKVIENVPFGQITLQHFGLIQEGKEITDGEEVEAIKVQLNNILLSQKVDKRS